MTNVRVLPGGLAVDGEEVLRPLLEQLGNVPDDVKKFLAERAANWEFTVPFPPEVIDAARRGGLDISPTAPIYTFTT